eukprot:322821-Prorocentrum_minimum.AAC.2
MTSSSRRARARPSLASSSCRARLAASSACARSAARRPRCSSRRPSRAARTCGGGLEGVREV